ncbi:hypothetical protein D3C72_1883550 [compost metagenome]
MGQLALAVGHGRRYPVDQHPHTAYPEGGARAEPADRQLGVLRVVLAVARDHPGNAAQGLGQLGQGAVAVVIEPHGGDRRRQVHILHLLYPRSLHLNGGQALHGQGLVGGWCSLCQVRQQHRRKQRAGGDERGETAHVVRGPRRGGGRTPWYGKRL